MTQTTERALRVLRAARALIARPYGWTKYTREKQVKQGTAYCAIGALHRASQQETATHWDGYELSKSVLSRAALKRLMGPEALPQDYEPLTTISLYNDSENTKKKDILNLFDEAIETLEATS
jgi:hypothetical protein